MSIASDTDLVYEDLIGISVRSCVRQNGSVPIYIRPSRRPVVRFRVLSYCYSRVILWSSSADDDCCEYVIVWNHLCFTRMLCSVVRKKAVAVVL